MYLVIVDNVHSTNSKMHDACHLMFTNKFTSMCLMRKPHVAKNSKMSVDLLKYLQPPRVVHLNKIHHFISIQ